MSVFIGQVVLEVLCVAVKGYRLKVAVRGHEYSAGRCFVHSARLDAHEPVLHYVNASDSVLSGYGVELFHEGNGFHPFAVDRYRLTLLEADFYVEGFVRRVLRRFCQKEHAVVRLPVGIFKYSPFVRDVQDVAVHAVGLILGYRERYVVLFCVVEELGAGVEFPFPPRRDNRQVRCKGLECHLEPHLVIALARGAVAHSISLNFARDLDLALRNNWPRQGCTEKVPVLVYGVCLNRLKYVVLNKLLCEVFDVASARAGFFSLGLEPCELLLLADIGRVGNDLAFVCFTEPLQDYGSVQSA